MKAKLFQLGKSEAVKAFWMFLLATIVSVVGDSIMQAATSGTYSFSAIHWKEIGGAIVVAVVAYLKKELITNSNGEILTKEDKKV